MNIVPNEIMINFNIFSIQCEIEFLIGKWNKYYYIRYKYYFPLSVIF